MSEINHLAAKLACEIAILRGLLYKQACVIQYKLKDNCCCSERGIKCRDYRVLGLRCKNRDALGSIKEEYNKSVHKFDEVNSRLTDAGPLVNSFRDNKLPPKKPLVVLSLQVFNDIPVIAEMNEIRDKEIQRNLKDTEVFHRRMEEAKRRAREARKEILKQNKHKKNKKVPKKIIDQGFNPYIAAKQRYREEIVDVIEENITPPYFAPIEDEKFEGVDSRISFESYTSIDDNDLNTAEVPEMLSDNIDNVFSSISTIFYDEKENETIFGSINRPSSMPTERIIPPKIPTESLPPPLDLNQIDTPVELKLSEFQQVIEMEPLKLPQVIETEPLKLIETPVKKKQDKKDTYTCECGKTLKLTSKYAHNKSAYHTKHLKK